MPNSLQVEAWTSVCQPGTQRGAVGCDVELALTVLKAIGVQKVVRARFNEYLGHYLGSASHRKQVAAFGLSSSEIDSMLELDSLS